MVIFLILGITLYLVSPPKSAEEVKTWSSFVYPAGYESGRYKKVDNFSDYASCKTYSIDSSNKV